MKKFIFILFLLAPFIAVAQCSCKLLVTQEFPGTGNPPISEEYSCGMLNGNFDSDLVLVEGSIFKLEFCYTFGSCSATGLGLGGGVPFNVLELENSNQGSLAYFDGSVYQEPCPNNQINQHSTEVHLYTPPSPLPSNFSYGKIEFYDISNEDLNGNLIVVYKGSISFKPASVDIDIYAFDDITATSKLVNNISSPLDPNGEEHTLNVAADGTKAMRLAFEEGSMEIRNFGGSEEYGNLLTTSEGVEYISPKKYNPNLTEIYFDYYPSTFSPNPIPIKVNINPVPVVLIHGLTANNSIWNNVSTNLLNNGWDTEHIFKPFFLNDASFVNSASDIHSQINTWLNQIKANGLFMNKINLIGHSMGGLIARQYTKDSGGAIVQKIITLNTPHSGSELANFVLDGAFSGLGTQMGDIVFSSDANFDINNGAMHSLRVNSSELLALNNVPNTNAKIHSISSEFTLCDLFIPEINSSSESASNRRFRIFVGTASRFLGFANFAVTAGCIFHDLILPAPNDFVVRVESQKGGLSGLANKNYAGLIGTYHNSTITNTSIIDDHLPSILFANPDGPEFSTNFSPAKLPPPSELNSNGSESLVSNSVMDLEISVDNITNLDTLYSSTLPDIIISGTDSISGIMMGYYFVDLDTILFDSVFSNSHIFQIPDLAFPYEGELIIHAMGVNGTGKLDYHGFVTTISQNNPPAPSQPILDSPSDGNNNSQINETLTWNNTANTSSYQLQLASDEFFTNVILDSMAIRSTSLSLTNLTFNTSYYWRVRATNPSGISPWSEVWSFTTSEAAPEQPNLITPLDTSTGIFLNTSFNWDDVQEADMYQLQIAKDDGFTELIIDESGLLTSDFDVTLPEYETTYYWKVRAINSSGEGPFSATWSFTTLIDVPSIPILTQPENGGIEIPLSVDFEWEDVQGADTYQLQIAKDIGFTELITDESGILTSSFNVTLPEYGTTYYWRVRSLNSTGESPFSGTWNFTSLMISNVEDLANKYNLKVYPNPTSNYVFVEFNSPISGAFNFNIFDSSGKIVLSLKKRISSGNNKLEIDTCNLPIGSFQYEMKIQDVTLFGQIIKM